MFHMWKSHVFNTNEVSEWFLTKSVGGLKVDRRRLILYDKVIPKLNVKKLLITLIRGKVNKSLTSSKKKTLHGQDQNNR